jgi:hypothetical protein
LRAQRRSAIRPWCSSLPMQHLKSDHWAHEVQGPLSAYCGP